ncbi:MAG TPA: response regulator [Anaeromyxobacteraceae bacterium]|nr:response regulator [Anaeromyxobacteraceae bacterium]
MTDRDATILVVDDDPEFRQSMHRFLRSCGFRCVLLASAQELLDRAPGDGPTCALVDLRMPGMSGLQLQSELARTGRRCAIVFLSGHGDVKTATQAMKGGAVDFLEKPFNEASLLDAIERALARDAAGRAEEATRDDARERLGHLTTAERKVVELLASGLRMKEVGAALGKAESTVRGQAWTAMSKLNVTSTMELARLLDAANR